MLPCAGWRIQGSSRLEAGNATPQRSFSEQVAYHATSTHTAPRTRKQAGEEKYQLEEEANYSFAYRDLFFPYSTLRSSSLGSWIRKRACPGLTPSSLFSCSGHINFMGLDPELGPIVISILKTRDLRDGSFLYLMRYDQVQPHEIDFILDYTARKKRDSFEASNVSEHDRGSHTARVLPQAERQERGSAGGPQESDSPRPVPC